MKGQWRTAGGALMVLAAMGVLSGCQGGRSDSLDLRTTGDAFKAECGPGSAPETGLQGQIPKADRDSGRNREAYSCNLSLVGQYQGQGASIVNATHDHCAYLSMGTAGALLSPAPGMQVVDVSDPAAPALAGNHPSPAMMIGTWESLKVNEPRGLVGAVAVGGLVGAGYFDIYEIGEDCTQPVHANGLQGSSLELPANVLGHEGNFSPDGNTYWATGTAAGSITAIDVSEPAQPQMLFTGLAGFPANHGVEFSPDGNTLYLATCFPGGLAIFDVSSVQNRDPVPMIQQISRISWNPRSCGQHALPVFFDGAAHLIVPDEFASEGIRIFNIEDPAEPELIAHIQLEIQLPEHAQTRVEDTAGNGAFSYESHYCSVDRADDPTALACGYFQSGIRVFDIRDPAAPREIAYYNPPAQPEAAPELSHSLHAYGGGIVPVISDQNAAGSDELNLGPYWFDYIASAPELLASGSNAIHGDMSADWCTSPPEFVNGQIWVACMDNGFMVLQFENGVYPLESDGS